MGPTWVLSAPGGSHVAPMNLAIWGGISSYKPFLHQSVIHGFFLDQKQLKNEGAIHCKSFDSDECEGNVSVAAIKGSNLDSMVKVSIKLMDKLCPTTKLESCSQRKLPLWTLQWFVSVLCKELLFLYGLNNQNKARHNKTMWIFHGMSCICCKYRNDLYCFT